MEVVVAFSESLYFNTIVCNIIICVLCSVDEIVSRKMRE